MQYFVCSSMDTGDACFDQCNIDHASPVDLWKARYHEYVGFRYSGQGRKMLHMDVRTTEECAEICNELDAQEAGKCKAFFISSGNCITIQDFNKDDTHIVPESTLYVNKMWFSTCLPGSVGTPGNCEMCSTGFYASGTEAECQ